VIAGKKVYLTAVERTSLEQLRAWRNSPSLRRYFREYREITSEMQEAWYRDRVLGSDRQVDFEIHDAMTGKLIGHTGLYYINWTDRTAEFTIYVGDMEFRGGGYGSDALRLLIEYGFNVLNLNRIWCEVYSNNGAVEIYRRLGFVDEGVKRQHHFDEGQYWDSYMLGLLRSEWRENSACA
jgi:RimJ/RimL family protein N-acetyltransferase